jgi:hypothetical protein
MEPCKKENEIKSIEEIAKQNQLELNGLGNTPGLKTEVDRLITTTNLLSTTVQTFSDAINKINTFMLSHQIKEEVIEQYQNKIDGMNGEKKNRNWALWIAFIGWMVTLFVAFIK